MNQGRRTKRARSEGLVGAAYDSSVVTDHEEDRRHRGISQAANPFLSDRWRRGYLWGLTRPKGKMGRSSEAAPRSIGTEERARGETRLDRRRRGGCDGALWSMGIAEKEEYDWKRGSFSWLVRSSSNTRRRKIDSRTEQGKDEGGDRGFSCGHRSSTESRWVFVEGKNKIVLVFLDWNPCRMKGNMGFIKRKRRREG
ncbi:unnamed protein product [Lactuca saligna]|uniref:Uncharacterized protein n=1 Tax=Lactuca saligna TaxID=75948 RepID=A0AA36DYB6_LACSI|nr:unnamed protein product [Lactuca saligna]